jgi:hypothetical protein
MKTFKVEAIITEERLISVEANSAEEAEDLIAERINQQLEEDTSPYGGVLSDIDISYLLAHPDDIPEEE